MNFSALRPGGFAAGFFPQYCLHCDALCQGRLCAACRDLLRAFPAHCRSCSRPMPQGGVCGACLRKPPAVEALFIAFCFETVARELVLKGKYAADRAALALMAELMPQDLPPVDALVPMPIAAPRLWQRGFNQTHYLAAALAKRCGTALEKRLLRKQARPPQSVLAAGERHRNIRGAFSLRGACPPSVLLVDDVYTTGATVREAALTLKQAGARQVYAAVFAAALFE